MTPVPSRVSDWPSARPPGTRAVWWLFLVAFLLVGPAGGADSGRNATLWTFDDPTSPFRPHSGDASLAYFDPDASGWGPAGTAFGTASSFGLPSMAGGDAHVMRFPALTARQGYRLEHLAPPNGPYGRSHGIVSNYTLIFDVLYPRDTDGQWRALFQTSPENANDAEFYVQNRGSGGVGTLTAYHGRIRPDTWHRLAIVVQAAPEEGKAQVFVDGRFVGGIGTTDAGLGIRWTLGPELLLFADGRGLTAGGYLSSFYFVDRAMSMDTIQALGGPHAEGALTPCPPAADREEQLPRTVGAIGHRGGFFCCAPDNTLAAVRMAIRHQIPVVEIDTRLSAEGVSVLMHDRTVDRTTDGTGQVSAMTVAQLKTLDAGSPFSSEFAGERVPTLAEVMTEAKGKLILYLDLKVERQVGAIVEALRESGFDPADCWFYVYADANEARSIRARLRSAKIIWSDPKENWSTRPDFFQSMRAIGVYGFDVGIAFAEEDPAFVGAAKAAGFVVAVHTIMDPVTMRRLALAGVDFLETDFPHIVRRLQR